MENKFLELEKSIKEMLERADIEKAIQQAKEKYKPLEEWRKAYPEKPKNLYEAVIQRETYREACIKVFGEY